MKAAKVRLPGRMVVGYVVLWMACLAAALAAWNANRLQESARRERLIQICSAIRDDREVLADVLTRALVTSRRTPQLEGFVAETNMRLARFPEFCVDLRQEPPKVVLTPLPTTTTTIPAIP